jgi:hypothetical protein
MLRAIQQKTMAKRIGGGIGTFEFQSLPTKKEDPLRESCVWEDPKEFLMVIQIFVGILSMAFLNSSH